MAQYDLNDSFAEHTDHTPITTAVHMRKYTKDQKRIVSGLHSPILWKLSLPNTPTKASILCTDYITRLVM